jgi:hypothetical protein
MFYAVCCLLYVMAFRKPKKVTLIFVFKSEFSRIW